MKPLKLMRLASEDSPWDVTSQRSSPEVQMFGSTVGKSETNVYSKVVKELNKVWMGGYHTSLEEKRS